MGQKQITDVLERSIKTGKIGHSYLFVGPRGTGKTSVARILAHQLNGFNYELEDEYLDIIEIDAASNTGVDNIRDLREKAIIAPTQGKYKVYIIDEIHMLSRSAFNALLKTLEEPPEHVIFIMATTEIEKVPITITSRSQVFRFNLADPSVMFDHLKQIAKQEKIKITDDALKIVVRRGGGSFRDSLTLLDQVSALSDDEITAELIEQALGIPKAEVINRILFAYKNGNLEEIRHLLAELEEQGIKPALAAGELIEAIIDDPEPILLPLLDRLTEVSRNDYPNVKLLLALSNLTPSAVPTIAAPIVKPQPISPPPAAPVKNTSAPPKPAESKPKEKPKVEPKPATKPEQEPAPTPPPANANPEDIWQNINNAFAAKSKFSVSLLTDVDYRIEGKIFKIYARNDFKKKQLEKKRQIITASIPSELELEISAETYARDSELAEIAELMGGGEEVQIDE